MRFVYVKDAYKVIINILSANGSRKLPNLESWFANFLAIKPSAYVNRKRIIQFIFNVKFVYAYL